MRFVSLVLISILVSGCASTYQKDTLTESRGKLLRDKSVTIAMPNDGRFGETVYAKSGEMTAEAVKTAFTPYSHEISIIKGCHDVHCLKTSSSDYLVLPEILHWEDRATEWSGLPDKVTIKISVFSGKDKSEKASAKLQGKSKWATFGGDHPQDLLQEPIESYVNSLY